MPLPMIHLAVVMAMAENEPIYDEPQHLLGSLAPDAIHMRPGWTREDKVRIHLRRYDGSLSPDVGSLLSASATAPQGQRDLAEGYAIHLLTDWLWLNDVVAELRSALGPVSLDALRAVYYADLDPLDAWLYQTKSWRPLVWNKLETAEALDLPGLVTAEEIDGWRRRTLAWFDDRAGESIADGRHITRARVEGFVARAGREMPTLLEQLRRGGSVEAMGASAAQTN